MSIVASILFAFAAVLAMASIRTSIIAALPSIRALRLALAEEQKAGSIRISTLDTRKTGPESTHRRSRRKLQPKPATHRLHRYPHRVHAA